MRLKLTADEAISCLPDGEYIHTYIAYGMLLGADWPREAVLNHLRTLPCEMAGPIMRKMGHGICLDKQRRLFVETVEERVAKFDEGEDPVEVSDD